MLEHHWDDGEIGLGDIQLAIEDLFRFGIEAVAAQVLMSRAVEVAARLNHPIYDCLYLALAERWDTVFVTADKKLRDRVRGSDWQSRITLLEDADQIA